MEKNAQKLNIKGIPLEALEQKMEELGHAPYRARQLFQWIYLRNEDDFSKMTDLSKAFRKDLEEMFSLPRVKIAAQEVSTDDTIKFLVELVDGQKVESVFIPMEDRNTLCVSTQVGCKMACTFCATGYQKFQRDLHAWEIVDQYLSLSFPKPVTNIVMMGMGEPFDNYDQMEAALKIFQHPMGCQLGKRHITVSTVGLTPKFKDFAEKNLAKLAISLHGTTEAQRRQIMPINNKHSIAEIMNTCRGLQFKGTQRVTFEYLLMRDFNDSDEDAHRLAKLVRGIPCKLNLLAYNENPFVAFKRPEEERILTFQRILLEHDLTVTYRRSRGRDIAAACGQLRTQQRLRANVDATPRPPSFLKSQAPCSTSPIRPS